MKRKQIVFICAALAAALTAAYITYENEAIGLTEYEYATEKLQQGSEGLNICHLSDIHIRSQSKKYSRLIKICADCQPDIIAITGDLIDSRDTDIPYAISLVETLCEIAPVYYVTGNHEERLPTDMYAELLSELSGVGVHVLRNSCEVFVKDGVKYNIIGAFDRSEPDFSAISALADAEAVNILLSHRPQFAEGYAYAGADLTLCGHAHGGQARLPFVGGVIAPDQFFFPEYYQGIHFFDGRATVISRGIGNSLIPVRVNNRPEVVAVKVKSAG